MYSGHLVESGSGFINSPSAISAAVSQSFGSYYYINNGETAAEIAEGELMKTEPDSTKWPEYMQEDVRALIAFPFWIAGVGIVCAAIGLLCVRTKSDSRTEGLQERLLNTIRFGMGFTGFLSAGCSFVVMVFLFGIEQTIGIKL